MQICTLLCANCHSVIHFDDDAPRSEVWKEMAAIKLQRGCAKCGYNEHSCALHFHHWGQKDFDISLGLRKPKDVLYAEVKKCSVLCSRCHAVLHYCCETVWPKGYWKQYRPGNVGGQDWRKVLDIGNSVVEGFAREPHLEIDIGESVIDGILREPSLRPEDAVEKTDLDNPLLIASTGELAWQLGIIESPKSHQQFPYGKVRCRLMHKMDENHIAFIRNEAGHCILNKRFPRRMTRREFAYRLILLGFHCVLCSDSLPSFWGKIKKHKLVDWLPKSAETLTLVIARAGYTIRVSSPALSIQMVLEEAVKKVNSFS